MKFVWPLLLVFLINAGVILYMTFSNSSKSLPVQPMKEYVDIRDNTTFFDNSTVDEFLYNSTVAQFLLLLSPLQPVILDVSLVECLIDRSSCAALQQNGLIRFGLPSNQFENLRQLQRKSMALANDEHVVFRIDPVTFILSKMYPVDQYFVVPGLPVFSLKSVHVPVGKLVPWHSALVMENLDLLRRFLKYPFVECKKDLAEKIRRENPEMYEEKNVVIKNSYIKTLYAFVQFSYSIGLHPMLTDGSLLGWYRECGFIPHTTDVDLTVFASEIGYTQVLQYELMNETFPQCRITEKLGFMNKSHHEYFQLKLVCAEVKADVFIFYNDERITWQGGRDVRWVYPLVREDDVCTAALLGHLFFIPCQVEEILKANYGIDWHIIRHSSEYSWNKSPKNIEKL